MILTLIAACAAGMVLGGVGAAVVFRNILRSAEQRLDQARAQLLDLTARHAATGEALEQERRHAQTQKTLFETMHEQWTKELRSLSTEALHSNSSQFLASASTLVQPLAESLKRFDDRATDMEKNRHSAFEVLRHQIQDMIAAQKDLKQETRRLVSALKTPVTRGRWGEMQLRRVVEMAGMQARCDFTEQQTFSAEEGGLLRPDMLVHLPGGKTLVVDAKTPLQGYLQALEATEEATRLEHMRAHARHVRQHIQQLGARQYWNQFTPAPDFVVLFLPGEAFFSAALEHDPSLIETGIGHKVILATPTTLIALLRTVAFGWQQEHMTRNIALIGQLGRDLYKRLHDMGKHLNRMGRQLGQTVEAYNQLAGNVEHRVLVTARRFQSLDTGTTTPLDPLPPLEHHPRPLNAPEWAEGEEG